MLELRDYQKEAISALWRVWRADRKARPLLVCPTGGGKSCLVAEIIRAIHNKNKTLRILVVAHRKEIIRQNILEFQALTQLPVGVVSAGLGRKDRSTITFANIQSIFRSPGEWEVIICDEAHLISQKSSSMYQALLKANPNASVVGLTATPMRLDKSILVGADGIFSEIAYEITMGELIAKGFLAPLISVCDTQIDTAGVRKVAGDFHQGELELVTRPLVHEHARAIHSRTKQRNKVLVFCTGVKHTEEMAAALGGKAITGDMPEMLRDLYIEQFARGEFKYLCNCEVLTLGFNVPSIDCVALVRATQSLGLYIQMVGRGSRIAPGKKDALILDFGGNINRHGPVDLIEVITKKDAPPQFRVPPLKSCDECGCVCNIRLEHCPACGAKFPLKTKLTQSPSSAPILSTQDVDECIDMHVSLHNKPDKPTSFRIDLLMASGRSLMEFLCFEHGGYASEVARHKWQAFGGGTPAPAFALHALQRQHELGRPHKVRVKKEKGFWRITKILSWQKDRNDDDDDPTGLNI